MSGLDTTSKGTGVKAVLGLVIATFLLDLQASIDGTCTITIYLIALVGLLLSKSRAPAANASIDEKKSTPVQPRTRKINLRQRIALTGAEVTAESILALFEKEEKGLTFTSAVDMIVALERSTKDMGFVECQEAKQSVVKDPRFAAICDVIADTVFAEGEISTISRVLWSLSTLGVKYGSGMRVLESLARAGGERMPDAGVGLVANILWSVSRMCQKEPKSTLMSFAGATDAEHVAFTTLVKAAAKAHVRDPVRPRKFRELSMTAIALARVSGFEIPDEIRFCMRDIARECSNLTPEQLDPSYLTNVLTAFSSMKVLSESESALLQPLIERMLSSGLHEGMSGKEVSVFVSECATRHVRADAHTCDTLAARFAKGTFDQWSALSLQWLASNMDFRRTTPETVDAMVDAMAREFTVGRGSTQNIAQFTYALSRNDWAAGQTNAFKRLGDLYVATEKEFQVMNHTLMAWSMARAGIYDEKVFCKVESELRGQVVALSAYGLSNTIWAFGRSRKLVHGPAHLDFFKELLDEATTRVPIFSRLEMRSILVGTLLKGCVTTPFLDAVRQHRRSMQCPQWLEQLDTLVDRLAELNA